MAKSREEKQEFLKKQIMESQYDISSFVDFMEEEKSNGGDVDNWSMGSLEDAVFRFKKSNDPNDALPKQGDDQQVYQDIEQEEALLYRESKIPKYDYNEKDQQITDPYQSDFQKQQKKNQKNTTNFDKITINIDDEESDQEQNKNEETEQLYNDILNWDIPNDEPSPSKRAQAPQQGERRTCKDLSGFQVVNKDQKMTKNQEDKTPRTQQSSQKVADNITLESIQKSSKMPKAMKVEDEPVKEKIRKQSSSKTDSQSQMSGKTGSNYKKQSSSIKDQDHIKEQRTSTNKKSSVQQEEPKSEYQKFLYQRVAMEPYEELIKTKDKRRTPQLIDREHRTLNIKINGFQEVSQGMFSSKGIVYNVKTTSHQWEVQRKLGDFYWLRMILVREFPSHFVPPLPKKIPKSTQDKLFYRKRLGQLQKFLEALISKTELRESSYMVAFLKISDNKQWSKVQEDLTKTLHKISDVRGGYSKKKFEGPGRIIASDFWNLQGKITAKISQEHRAFSTASYELLTNSFPVYKKMKTVTKELVKNFDAASLNLKKLGEYSATLSKYESDFARKSMIGQHDIMAEAHFAMKEMFDSWSEMLYRQVKIAQSYLQRSFQYSKHETSSLNELLKLRSQMGGDYAQSFNDLEARKEKLVGMDLSKWEIDFQKLDYKVSELAKDQQLAKSVMLSSDTLNVFHMKQVFGYLNEQFVKESLRVNEQKVERYYDNFMKFCIAQKEVNSENGLIFDQFMTRVSNMQQRLEIRPFAAENKLDFTQFSQNRLKASNNSDIKTSQPESQQSRQRSQKM